MEQEISEVGILPEEVELVAGTILAFMLALIKIDKRKKNDRATEEIVSLMGKILNNENRKGQNIDSNFPEGTNCRSLTIFHGLHKETCEIQKKQNCNFIEGTLKACKLFYSEDEMLYFAEFIEKAKGIPDERKIKILELMI